MTSRISFVSANYVARQLGYHMTEGWMQGDAAANAYYEPLETFPERFEELLRDIRALDFDTLDLWTAHLNPLWTTPEHLAVARDLLDKHSLSVISLAGSFGATREAFEAHCRLARALDISFLGGMTSLLYEDRPFVVETLRNYGLKLGIENHPEKNPEEMLAKIGDGEDGTIGTTVDTGWYGSQGYDAARAIEVLGEHILHVHLKDVRAPGGHDTCRYGEGVVPVEECVRVLQQMGYEGAISVEHEPEHYDPTEECRENLVMLRGWLGEGVRHDAA